MKENNNQSAFKEYLLPVSILVAAVLVSGSLVISANSGNQTANTSNSTGNSAAQNVAEVTEDDYIRGSIDAPIKIIEFSDLECPFCQQFHSTMKQVRDSYGDQVAWVYRQFPVQSLHPKAPEESEAAECVGALGGNEAFWEFTDLIFEVSPGNNGLDLSKLPDYAERVGIDRAAFNECMESDQYVSNVDEDIDDAINSGARGTPYSIIVTENGEYVPIPGALPFSDSDPTRPDMQTILDSIISEL